MTGPCFIFSYCKVRRKFFQLIFFYIGCTVIGILFTFIVAYVKFFMNKVVCFHCKTDLVKVIFETIVFKKLLVIRWIKVHAIHWWNFMPFYYQPPPAVSFAEIYRAIHCLHPLLHQPMFCYIKKHIGCSLIIDAIKKTNTTYRNIISFIFIFLICKGGNTTDGFSLIIF